MSDQRMAIAEAFATHWRGMYGSEGLLLVNATQEPTEEQLDTLAHAVAPLTTDPVTSVVLVGEKVPTFTTPQRSYQRAPASEMLPDPADHPEYTNEHTPEAIAKVGAWRWGIVAKHKDAILPLIRGRRTIDFGGLAGPIGYGSIIVDHGSDEYRALYDVPGKFDCIFTAHTLEHVQDYLGVLRCMEQKLERGGWLVVVVPSFRFEFLRAEHYPHHHHTFCLAADSPTYAPIDAWIAECVGDVILTDDDGESIVVIARKR